MRMATYIGTRGARMAHVNITEQMTGRNGKVMVSSSSW